VATMLALVGVALVGAVNARADILPPVTVDGPSPQIVGFGNVAMASDGTGGLVYLKAVNGIPHVFAGRFVEGTWSAPIRVDSDRPYGASQPVIAAGPGGALMVVWVSGAFTAKGKVQYALFSARIGAGASEFGHSLVVDPNVGGGVGVDPSLVGATPSKAIVAYRVITFEFSPNSSAAGKVQLRPGDDLAEIRVARLNSERWSRLGAMNRNPEASMRPPSPTNGPQIGEGAEGNAVVAWQEPDQTGTARIWLRRIFGTVPGPVLQASPSTWESQPVSADAEAFSLAVTPYEAADVAFQIGATSGSALAGRVLVNSLPPKFSTTAKTLNGAQPADGAAAGPGAPDLSAAERSQPRETLARLGFLSGSSLQLMAIGAEGKGAIAVPTSGSLAATPGGVPVVAADPEGGGTVAYPAVGPGGVAGVAVRQELGSGPAQTGFVSGVESGPVAGLSVGRAGDGSGMVAFRQGEPGRFEVVADQFGVPPASFQLNVPKAWSRPGAVKLRWEPAATTAGPVRYAVVVGGVTVRKGLTKLSYRPRRADLGNGAVKVRVLATDQLGEEVASEAKVLRIDAEPPTITVHPGSKLRVVVRLRDQDSGVNAKASRVSFGDGSRERGGTKFVHTYAAPGRYTVTVGAVDKVGNRVTRHFEVTVK
jgi:PKD domain